MADGAPRRREHRIGGLTWLRAAVLGANDGILTLSSLMLGVAFASHATTSLVLVGIAALVSGAFAMAAGEYVSVSSQADFETAELELERLHLDADALHVSAALVPGVIVFVTVVVNFWGRITLFLDFGIRPFVRI